ncbi:MAG: Ldh family oxidoreductase [Alphaproteobacteria bacterium]|nr:Ldh family oxidoreductase [Alphaproteobacteria bacterium]
MSEIKIDDLKELCIHALTKTGLSDEHARLTVDHYLENELSGKKSHGMVRVIQVNGAIKKIGIPEKPPEITTDNGNIAVINGQMNLGPVVGKMVVDESIKRAKQHGLSLVGMNYYFGNTGSMAYYLRRLAEENLIGVMSCNSECMVAAPTGKERLLGTNPIGLCIPSEDGNHFIADFATSAIAYGKVLVALDKDEALPKGCIIDKDGNPSTNPKDAESDGAILPLADYRGFALGLFVEMIGLMIGAEVLHNDTYGKDGLFIIAIDPSKLSAGYAAQVATILNHMRESAPAPGHDHVSIPGDRSLQTLKETLERGAVDVADRTLEKIKELAT